jgi:hypothetical protein
MVNTAKLINNFKKIANREELSGYFVAFLKNDT